MRCLDQLKDRLKGKTAEEAIDTLSRTGALSDTLARRCIAVEEFKDRYGKTDESARSVQEDIAFELGTTRETVFRYVERGT